MLWYYGEDIHLDFCYQLDFLLDIFMRDRSYQELKDATSFGLICGKSAEIQGSEYWKNCQFSILANSVIFAFLLPSCSYANWPRVTSHACAKALFSENSVWARFQNIKYFKSDYIALLSDNRANKVASCRY